MQAVRILVGSATANWLRNALSSKHSQHTRTEGWSSTDEQCIVLRHLQSCLGGANNHLGFNNVWR